MSDLDNKFMAAAFAMTEGDADFRAKTNFIREKLRTDSPKERAQHLEEFKREVRTEAQFLKVTGNEIRLITHEEIKDIQTKGHAALTEKGSAFFPRDEIAPLAEKMAHVLMQDVEANLKPPHAAVKSQHKNGPKPLPPALP